MTTFSEHFGCSITDYRGWLESRSVELMISPAERRALVDLIETYLPEEARHFRRTYDASDRRGHVYKSWRRLERLLERLDQVPS